MGVDGLGPQRYVENDNWNKAGEETGLPGGACALEMDVCSFLWVVRKGLMEAVIFESRSEDVNLADRYLGF